MHIAFIPYGARTEVERFMRDVESQKFQLKLWNNKGEEKHVWVNGQIRELPFGVKEIVFPREYKDIVMSTLLTHTAPNRQRNHYAYKPIIALLRKGLKLEAFTSEYDKSQRLLWDMEYVSIIPLGIRKDVDLTECKDMGYKGWDHEAL